MGRNNVKTLKKCKESKANFKFFFGKLGTFQDEDFLFEDYCSFVIKCTIETEKCLQSILAACYLFYDFGLGFFGALCFF